MLKFGWSHIFNTGELDLIVEFDETTKTVIAATAYATQRLLNTEELNDLRESIKVNIQLAGGWSKFRKELRLLEVRFVRVEAGEVFEIDNPFISGQYIKVEQQGEWNAVNTNTWAIASIEDDFKVNVVGKVTCDRWRLGLPRY